jgi:transcription termination factor Rho
LRTGDTIVGKIRPPKEGERYFACSRSTRSTSIVPRTRKQDSLREPDPLFPTVRMKMEAGNGSTEDLTGRVIDLCAPIGKASVV